MNDQMEDEEFVLTIDAPFGLSQVEIADIFCCTRQCVQNVEASALRKLRRIMDEDPELAIAFSEIINEGMV